MWTLSTIEEFKAYFVRDFPYGTDISTTVLDADIDKAIRKADQRCNQDLFSSQDSFTDAFMLLVAHCLVVSLRTSSQGLASSFMGLENSKGVGSVSHSVAIPDRIMQNPEYAWISTTGYGEEYLMIVLPLLSGAMFTVCGGTNA